MSKVIFAAAFALAAFSTAAAAQDRSNRPITLIVPFAPGGGIDASAQQAAALSEILGQTIVVENVGAAAGTVGSARVSSAEPDGHTFLIGNTGTHAYSQSLYKKRPYDAAADFTPIGLVSESPAHSDCPQGSAGEQPAGVRRLRQSEPGQDAIRLGVGSGTHLPCALLNLAMGVDIVHVPYRGAGPADAVDGRQRGRCAATPFPTGPPRSKAGP